jgi:Tol biopolymer transport system component/DNA-binding winged helix-turn-helix (wHTH) protein
MSLENFPKTLLNFSEREMNGEAKHFYQFKSFRLDVEERQLFQDGDAVPLTPKAFDVLAVLVERAGHLVEKDELLRVVWADSFVEESNVPRIVHTLRKVLGEVDNVNKFIETVPKSGYRFVADVLCTENESGDFFEARSEMAAAGANAESNTTINNDFVDEFDRADSFPVAEKSEKRFLLWAIAAVALIGFGMIIASSLFNSSDAKFGNALTFERMRQTRLTQSGDVYTPTISPDGQYLAYINPAGASRRGLRLRQVATGQILELVPPRPNVNFWALEFSPDSNYLYYVEDDGSNTGFLYRIASLGGQPQKLVDFVSGCVTASPDGTRLAFKRINKQVGVTSIIVVNNDGSNEQTIATTNSDSDYWSLDWSLDGSTIAYAINLHEAENNLWYVAEVPASGGAEWRIGESRAKRIINARWLPDRKGLILNQIDPQTKLPQLYYLPYPDGAERRITNDLNEYFGFSITADGKSIVSQRSEQNRHIWLVSEADAKQTQQLTFKNGQHFDAVTWLSDDTLVFDADENGSYDNHNIWRLKIEENEPQQLTTGAGNNTLPTAAPDGKTIAFVSSRSGKPQIWRMNADGTQPRQITDVDFGIYQLQFSPDGQTLYFKSSIGGAGRLMSVSINGGEAVPISEADVHEWAISPDGKKLAYSFLDPDTQKVVTRIRPTVEDRTEKVFNLVPETWLQWTKDGQALDFNLAADNAKNIWRQSLSATKPRQITDFDKEKIFRFASSPDGKDIACIRFAVTFDAVMLNFDK